MISVGGNLCSVPEATRRRTVEVHTLANEVQIFEGGELIARHPMLEGSRQRRVEPGHRRSQSRQIRPGADHGYIVIRGAGDVVTQRPLEFYEAIGRVIALENRP